MGAWPAWGKARIGLEIVVNIGWWGVSKNVFSQDRSKSKTVTMAEEISAWGCQITDLQIRNTDFCLCYSE